MEAIRQGLRDRVPKSTRQRLIHAINRLSGNYLSRPLYGKATYNRDGLATAHNADFIEEPRFEAAYEAGKATGSWTFGDPTWRAYIVCWATERGALLDGDFVECGVNRGGYALTAISTSASSSSPSGSSCSTPTRGWRIATSRRRRHARGVRVGEYEPCYEAVVRTFSPYPNVTIIKGAVPETLSEVTAERIAFLSLDMNTREPEIAAAECFWDRLSSGAAIVLDDYGWRKHFEQKLAFDEFARHAACRSCRCPPARD